MSCLTPLAGFQPSPIGRFWVSPEDERLETTQIYLEATLAMKEKALAKTSPAKGRPERYKPGDRVLAFLNSL